MKKIELCIKCGDPTGKAGRLDDSLYDDGNGPYCEACFPGQPLDEAFRRAYRQNNDVAFDEALLRMERLIEVNRKRIPHEALCFFKDGNNWCCVHGDFIDLQQSPAGFGETFEIALSNLTKADYGQSA